MALGHFGAYLDSPTEKQRTLSRFRLLYIKQFRKLDELKSISEEGLIDEGYLTRNLIDELLLKKNPPIFYDEKKDYPLGPSINEIMVATASISIKPALKPNSKTVSPNFQLEIRKVLLTLIQTSHSLICLNPESKHVFQILQTSQTLSQTPNLSGSNTAVNNPNNSNNNGDHTLNDGGLDAIANSPALRNLEEMGFNKKLAMRALIINRMDVSRATEWLLENSTSENITTSLPNSGTLSIPSSNNNNNNFIALNPNIEIKTKIQSSTEPNAQRSAEKTAVKNSGFNEDVLSPDNDTPRKIVMAFRAYKAKLYVPDPQAIANLKEMGFEEQDILQALALCNNNEDAACEWLLQDSSSRQKTLIGKSMQLSNTTIHGDMENNSKQLTQEKGTTMNNVEMDLEFQTLSPNSSLCRALLSDPTILLGLNNPKMFLILLNLYEMFIQTHALHIGHWFNDPDAAVLLSQIFRIYHSEKYSLLTQSQSQPVNSTSTSNDFSGNDSNNNNGNGEQNLQSDNLDGIDRSDMFFIPSTTSFESLSHNPFNPGDPSIGGDIPVVDYMLNEDGIDIDTDANGFSYDDEYDVHDYVNPDNPSIINNGDNSTSNFNFNNNNSNNLYENFRTTHGFINEFIIEGSGSDITSRNDDNYRRSNYRSPRLSHQNNDYIGRNATPRSFNNNVIGSGPQNFMAISSSSEAIITQHGSNDYYNIRSPTLLHTTLASRQPYNLYHTSRLTSTNHRMGRDTLTRSENYLGSSLAPRRNVLGNNDNSNNTENDSNETGVNKRISNPNPPHYSLMANNQNTSTDSINRSLISLDPDYYDQNNFSNESSMITPSSTTMLITSNTGGLSTAHMHYSNPKPLNLNLATATMSSLENVESRITPTWEERIGIGGNNLNRDGSSNSVSLNTLLTTTPTNTASKSSEMVNLTSEQGEETPLANTMDRGDINYSNPTLSDTHIEPPRTNENHLNNGGASNGKYRSILDSVPETHYHTIHSLFSSSSSKNSDNHHPSTLLLHKPPLSYNQSSLSNTISNPNPNLSSYASTSVQDVGHTKKNETDRKFKNSNSYSNGNNNFSISANPLDESLTRYPNYNTSQSYSSSALDSNRDTSTLNIRGESTSYGNYSSNLSGSNYKHPYQLPHSSDLNISHNYESSRYPSVSHRRKYYPSSSENLDDSLGYQISNRTLSTQTGYNSSSGRPNITVDSYSRSRGESTEPHDLYSSYGSNRNYLSTAANHTLSTSSTTSYGYPYRNAVSTSYQSYSSSRPSNNYVGSSRENSYGRNSSTTHSTNNGSRNSANNSSYSQYLGPDSTYDSIYNRTRHWRY